MLFFPITASAQVPNGSFEHWETIGSYQEPEGWYSRNILTVAFGGGMSCVPVSPGYSGTYAAKVTTVETFFGVQAGMLMSGDQATGVDGFPVSGRPQALNGWWKRALVSGDEASISVVLTRWDPVARERVLVGVGAIGAEGNTSSWAPFSVNITYLDLADPDTVMITMVSGAVAGSNITVDDLSLAVPVGLPETHLGNAQVFPVPAMHELNLITEVPMSEVELWTMDGRPVSRSRPGSVRAVVDLRGLAAGAYTVVARMTDGTLLRRKVVVKL